MTTLRLDFCSHEAAKHAIMRWHYSRQLPKSKLLKIGAWEDEKFRGAIVYGLGANRHIASPFGLQGTEVCELVRVALAPGRVHPTSRCVAISLKLLHRHSPGIKLVVSYADSGQGHAGTIYQASNWIFLGGSEQSYIKVLGKVEHPRSLYDRYGRKGQSIPWLRANVDPRADRVPNPPKWKYVYPFDPKLRRQLEAQAHPYPKRGRSDTSDTPGAQPGEGEAASTRPLHTSPNASVPTRSTGSARRR